MFLFSALLLLFLCNRAGVVVDPSNILYHETFGYRSLSNNGNVSDKRVDSDSIFLLASITKTFLAVSAMQLVERNLLELDEEINTYLVRSSLPSIKNPLLVASVENKITMRHLLTHTSGVSPKTDSRFYLPYDNYTINTTLREFCFDYLLPSGKLYSSENWLNVSVGMHYNYSNIGAALAGMVIELISNTSYSKYVEENILKPLNMSDASWTLAGLPSTNDLVEHYAFNTTLADWLEFAPNLEFRQINESWIHIGFFGIIPYPAGLLRMSALSLSKYLRMFINNGTYILKSTSIEQIRTVQYPNVSSTSGLIWTYFNFPNRPSYLGHVGIMPGVTTVMVMNPETNIGVIVLTNADTLNTEQGTA
ncbi:unnamed protein product, partial [Didymodactylos carnosus]